MFKCSELLSTKKSIYLSLARLAEESHIKSRRSHVILQPNWNVILLGEHESVESDEVDIQSTVSKDSRRFSNLLKSLTK